MLEANQALTHGQPVPTGSRRWRLVEVPVHDTWKIPFLMFLLEQLNEAKTLVQEDKANLLQGLIDILVRI